MIGQEVRSDLAVIEFAFLALDPLHDSVRPFERGLFHLLLQRRVVEVDVFARLEEIFDVGVLHLGKPVDGKDSRRREATGRNGVLDLLAGSTPIN